MTLLNRFTVHRVFAGAAILSAIVGFSDAGTPAFSGLFRALAAISCVLFLIFNFLKNEKTDEEIVAEERPAETRVNADSHHAGSRMSAYVK